MHASLKGCAKRVVQSNTCTPQYGHPPNIMNKFTHPTMVSGRPNTFLLSPIPKIVWQNSTKTLESFLLIVKESSKFYKENNRKLIHIVVSLSFYVHFTISIKHLLLKIRKRKKEKTRIEVIVNNVVFSRDSLLSTRSRLGKRGTWSRETQA